MRSSNRMSAVLIAIVLVACSVSGLAAGVYARRLGDSFAVAATTTPPLAASRTPLPATATSAPAAPATATPRPTGTGAFVLTVVSSPNALAPGQSVTITVTALTRDRSKAPIAGLKCFMRAPSDGRAPLFQSWPPPVFTGANGVAAWNLTAPQVASGLYGVEVVAYGTNSYLYYADAFITITG